MRDDLIRALEIEYDQIRAENEREEIYRKERIRREFPDIYDLTSQREELVFGTLRDILNRNAETDTLQARMKELSLKIRQKLQENHLPEDYLSPVYRCSICRDTGYTGSPVKSPCECLKKAYQQKLRLEIGLAENERETFEQFDCSLFSAEKLPGRNYSQRELMERCKQICEEWSDAYPQVPYRDLLLTGKSGLGKTFLLRAMADRLIRRDVHVLMISAFRLLEISRKSYFSNEDTSTELTDADVLIIDDLGTEPLMQNVTIEQLFNLINERQSLGKSTLISTNLDMAEFRNRYTERIASRMLDRKNCKILSLEGKDIRT